jgi:hypothetical protein
MAQLDSVSRTIKTSEGRDKDKIDRGKEAAIGENQNFKVSYCRNTQDWEIRTWQQCDLWSFAIWL